MSLAPHHDLPKPKIATIVVVDIGISPSHPLAKAGPFGIEESQTLDSSIYTAHLKHAHAIDINTIILPFVPRQHRYVIASICQPPGHN
jgi:hypothetical protein